MGGLATVNLGDFFCLCVGDMVSFLQGDDGGFPLDNPGSAKLSLAILIGKHLAFLNTLHKLIS